MGSRRTYLCIRAHKNGKQGSLVRVLQQKVGVQPNNWKVKAGQIAKRNSPVSLVTVGRTQGNETSLLHDYPNCPNIWV